jgi:hypothetical protein
MPRNRQTLGGVMAQTLASLVVASVKPSISTSITRLQRKTAKKMTQTRTLPNSHPVTTEDMTTVNRNASLQPKTLVLPSGPRSNEKSSALQATLALLKMPVKMTLSRQDARPNGPPI